MPVLHHTLLAVAVLALGGAGLRVASLAAPAGLERVLVAATLAFAAAVVEVLVLGLAGLSGSSPALAAAAGLTWLAARRLPAPERSLLDELTQWWAAAGLGKRLVTGALAGAWLVWVAWLLRHAVLGFDTVLYHASEAVVWVGSGHAAQIEPILHGLPVTNYPITDEVFVTWAMGLSHSFVPLSLVVPAQIALLGVAAWSGLRALGIARLPAALATVAVLVAPAVIAWQSNGALTDPAMLAWLVTCGALCALSRARPVLLAPAVVAAGLAIGTKTTAAPLALAVLGAALWLHRERLRGLWKPLTAALALATAAGGVWYLRNLFDHGSPLWPFVAAPWGTPLPPGMDAANETFAAHPRETIDVVGDLYLERFLGGIVLLAGALVAPLLAWRRRAVWLASAAAVASFLIWANAPFTGVPPVEVRIAEGVFSTTRYLLPALAAAALALALAANGRSPGARIAQLVLAAAAGIELVQAFRLGFPTMPAASTPVVGAVAGAALAAGLHRLPRLPPVLPARARIALTVAAVAIGALLALPADGFVRRHSDARLFAADLNAWFAARPDDELPVASAPAVVATLTGDRLRRRLEPIPPRATCADVREHERVGYVVLYRGGGTVGAERTTAGRCIGRPPVYRDDLFQVWAPGSP